MNFGNKFNKWRHSAKVRLAGSAKSKKQIRSLVSFNFGQILSKIFSNVFDLFEAININSFLNQFTTLEFLFGSGILVILSWSILRSFKFR